MRIAVLVLLAGCGEPTGTGPYALVGRLVDASGAPVAGQVVESVEGRDTTDASGDFVVEWKPPSQHADFTRDGVSYSRGFREDDDGKRVELRLPATREALVRCERAAPCDLQLRWDLGEGLSARIPVTCALGDVVALAVVPDAAPTAKCAGTPDHPESDAPIVLFPEGWAVQDSPQAVRVEVHAETGDEPRSCAVSIAGRAIEGSGTVFEAQASGRVVVTGACDGRAATPQVVAIHEPMTVALDWSSIGPDLDLGPWLPGASFVTIEALGLDEGVGGWRLDVRPRADGVFPLPPLPKGIYHVSAGNPGPPAAVEGQAGKLVLAPLARDADGKVVGVQGALLVGSDTTDGAVPVIAP